MTTNTAIDVARTKRFVVITLFLDLSCERDGRPQTTWCGVRAGSTKKEFSYLTSSSSLSMLNPVEIGVAGPFDSTGVGQTCFSQGSG
jgi:hypothetical protein